MSHTVRYDSKLRRVRRAERLCHQVRRSNRTLPAAVDAYSRNVSRVFPGHTDAGRVSGSHSPFPAVLFCLLLGSAIKCGLASIEVFSQ